jgi:hypothetical protein
LFEAGESSTLEQIKLVAELEMETFLGVTSAPSVTKGFRARAVDVKRAASRIKRYYFRIL